MTATCVLLGERVCQQPEILALAFQTEATSAFQATDWHLEFQTEQVKIESAEISGDLAPTHLRVMKACAEVPHDAARLFAFLTSATGFAVLDPVSHKADHEKPVLQQYDWKPGARLELATATIAMPILHREFLVLNAIDSEACLFVSKSVTHPDYQSQSRRPLNTFAIQVRSLGTNKSQIEILNYLHLSLPGSELAWIMNFINCQFLKKLSQNIASVQIVKQTII
ncbi:MAG: hypothetical protein ACRCWD_04205 [Culicoidibacterales bacterium]